MRNTSTPKFSFVTVNSVTHALQTVTPSAMPRKKKDGTTPLILASANGHVECVKELLEQGADPGAKRNLICSDIVL
ncbi:hypothetical protein Avbf_02519 [Armadillidium vulgare]|nr:hypothetical protein Avbf_02519 [Armadillidium vulgare]